MSALSSLLLKRSQGEGRRIYFNNLDRFLDGLHDGGLVAFRPLHGLAGRRVSGHGGLKTATVNLEKLGLTE